MADRRHPPRPQEVDAAPACPSTHTLSYCSLPPAMSPCAHALNQPILQDFAFGSVRASLRPSLTSSLAYCSIVYAPRPGLEPGTNRLTAGIVTNVTPSRIALPAPRHPGLHTGLHRKPRTTPSAPLPLPWWPTPTWPAYLTPGRRYPNTSRPPSSRW